MPDLRFVETQQHVAAIAGERVVGTIGVLSKPGGVGLVFPPDIDGGPPDLAVQLVAAALVRLRRTGAAFAQLAVPPEQEALAAPFLENGFQHLTDAQLLIRPPHLEPPPAVPLGPGRAVASSHPVDPDADRLLLEDLIGRINEGTLDCPELDRLRTPAMMLAAHRDAACEGRAWWRRWDVEGQPVGLLLACVLEQERTWELLFFGVVPEARGSGIGTAMLHEIITAAHADEASVRAGVDIRNLYAHAIYDACGFHEEGSLRVWVHPLAEPS